MARGVTPEFDLATFSRASAAGDAETFVELFVDDAQALQHEEPALVVRRRSATCLPSCLPGWTPAGFEVDYDVVDVYQDRAYVLAGFREMLRPRDDSLPIDVHGRLVVLWQREDDGRW